MTIPPLNPQSVKISPNTDPTITGIHKRTHNSTEMKKLFEFVKNELNEYELENYNVEITVKITKEQPE